MNKRDIMLVGAGLVVGYLLAGYYLKNKPNAQMSTSSTEPMIDQAKIDACNKEVANFMASAEFKSDVDLDKIKKDKFDACMAKKA